MLLTRKRSSAILSCPVLMHQNVRLFDEAYQWSLCEIKEQAVICQEFC